MKEIRHLIFTFQTLHEWQTNYLFVSADAYDDDNKEQDEEHNSTADGNTKPDVHWGFLCETIDWQQKRYTFNFTCITLSLFLSLLLPIFNGSTAYVNNFSFFQSSHFHWPLCPLVTSGKDRKGEEGRVEEGKEQERHVQFTLRSGSSGCPNVHVRFTIWPS